MLKNTALRIGIAAVLATEVGGAINHEMDNGLPAWPPNVPAIVEDVKWPIDLIHSKSENFPPAPSTFDNSLDKQYVQAGVNTQTISQEDLPSILKGSIKPPVKGSFPDESILFPVKATADQAIKVETGYVRGAWNPLTKKLDTLPIEKTLTIEKKGTEIVVPVEGAEVFKLKLPDEQELFGIAFQFFGSDGTKYFLYTSSNFYKTFIPAEAIDNAPIISPFDLWDNTPNAAKGKGLVSSNTR